MIDGALTQVCLTVNQCGSSMCSCEFLSQSLLHNKDICIYSLAEFSHWLPDLWRKDQNVWVKQVETQKFSLVRRLNENP